MKKRVKKAQFQLSFSMIFSMILVVVFLVVAFIVIKNFLELSKQAEEYQSYNDLNKELKRLSDSTSSVLGESFDVKINNDKITHICFFNPEENQMGRFREQYENLRVIDYEHNFYFYPSDVSKVNSEKIERVNMTSFRNNPQCFIVENGKATLILNKDIGEYFVRVE